MFRQRRHQVMACLTRTSVSVGARIAGASLPAFNFHMLVNLSIYGFFSCVFQLLQSSVVAFCFKFMYVHISML